MEPVINKDIVYMEVGVQEDIIVGAVDLESNHPIIVQETMERLKKQWDNFYKTALHPAVEKLQQYVTEQQEGILVIKDLDYSVKSYYGDTLYPEIICNNGIYIEKGVQKILPIYKNNKSMEYTTLFTYGGYPRNIHIFLETQYHLLCEVLPTYQSLLNYLKWKEAYLLAHNVLEYSEYRLLQGYIATVFVNTNSVFKDEKKVHGLTIIPTLQDNEIESFLYSDLVSHIMQAGYAIKQLCNAEKKEIDDILDTLDIRGVLSMYAYVEKRDSIFVSGKTLYLLCVGEKYTQTLLGELRKRKKVRNVRQGFDILSKDLKLLHILLIDKEGTKVIPVRKMRYKGKRGKKGDMDVYYNILEEYKEWQKTIDLLVKREVGKK